MNRTQKVSKNVIWGIMSKVIGLGLPFVTRTVMIYTLGMMYVGLGSLFTSILQVLSFAELGIGSALVFGMYKPMADNDDEKICALLNLYRSTYRVIGTIILVVGIAMMPFLKYLVAGELPKDINLQILFLIYLVNNLVGYFLYAYKQSLFTASQRVDVISKISMAIQLLLNIIQIFILVTVKNYYAYIIVLPISTVINNILVGYFTDKAFPRYKCSGSISESEKKEITKNVKGLIFQKIGNIILTSADSIVISSFLGLKILGIYNGYFCIISAFFGFLTVIHQAIIPSVGNCVVTDTKEKNLKNFYEIQFLYLWIVIWVCACLLVLLQPFIKIWQGQSNILPNTTVVLLAIYFFTYKMGDICWMYREALGLWWEARYIPFISSVCNLVMNIVLVRIIGLNGVIISTILSLFTINFPWSSKVIFSNYFKSKNEWFKYILKTLLYFLMMVLVSSTNLMICALVKGENFSQFIIKLIICIFAPNIILLLLNIKNKNLRPAVCFVLGIIPKRFIPKFAKRYIV